MTFKQVAIGQSFDWIGGPYPSFFKRCVKISARRYQDSDGVQYRVGSVTANVYHVGETP